MDKTYKTTKMCENCETHVELTIPYGVAFEPYDKNHKGEITLSGYMGPQGRVETECSNCGLPRLV